MAAEWQTIGSALVLLLLPILKSYHSGRIRSHLDERKRSKSVGDRAHGEINDHLEEIHSTVQQTDQKVDRLAEAFVVVNERRDDVDVAALRDRLGVDQLNSDLVADGDEPF